MSLKVVRLIDSDMCLSCRFHREVMACAEGQRPEPMILCTRGDCDNWDTKGAANCVSVDGEAVEGDSG
jgi:hypothetical protein